MIWLLTALYLAIGIIFAAWRSPWKQPLQVPAISLPGFFLTIALIWPVIMILRCQYRRAHEQHMRRRVAFLLSNVTSEVQTLPVKPNKTPKC